MNRDKALLSAFLASYGGKHALRRSNVVNRNVFGTFRGRNVPEVDAMNLAGGVAYSMPAKHALAQMSVTGCFNGTFYAYAEEQLGEILALCREVDAGFVAKTAVYCREQGFMKDMPAFLCAYLSTKDPALMKKVFHRVINNGKMIRNFVQIMRSGAVGRKSMGSAPRNMVREWFDKSSPEYIFKNSIGNDPSLVDVVKMTHPKPNTDEKSQLLKYLLGKDFDPDMLPEIVKHFELFKKGHTTVVPDLNFQFLSGIEGLSKDVWKEIARKANWTTTRMNLNTFLRHGVFEDPKMVAMIATRLMDKQQIIDARCFPYQLMVTYFFMEHELPNVLREAVQEALETSLVNVPTLEGKVLIGVDVSGSMSAPITGSRKGATSKCSCSQVAALIASAMLRKNPDTVILPFNTQVLDDEIFNPRDSVVTNSDKIARLMGGGTSVSAPLYYANSRKISADLVLIVSDNESWADFSCRGTALMSEWEKFRARNPKAKMVCMDLSPNTTTQGKENPVVLNVGGFSDQVFTILDLFVRGKLGADHWVGEIDKVVI